MAVKTILKEELYNGPNFLFLKILNVQKGFEMGNAIFHFKDEAFFKHVSRVNYCLSFSKGCNAKKPHKGPSRNKSPRQEAFVKHGYFYSLPNLNFFRSNK